MPAIHLPRLRQQVEALVPYYASPEKFLRGLRDMFEFYGDHTRRSGEQSEKPTALPVANLPPPVLRQILLQMVPYAENAPHTILVLARTLWKQPVLEYRLLAAQLLGKLPIQESEDVYNLVHGWTVANHEEILLNALATSSLETIQKEDPGGLIERIEGWLYPVEAEEEASGDGEGDDLLAVELSPIERRSLTKLGLIALLPYVKDYSYQNLPKIYTLLKPLMRQSEKVLRPYLLDLLRPLARRSPQEIAFILRTELDENRTANIAWLGRRLLSDLPDEHQTRLREILFPQDIDN
ncbi:MAG: DNA alkylation repair protein [Anaerolineales bacterium]|jgi:hypothetical protein